MTEPSTAATEPGTDFLGREAELGALLAGLAQARSGRGGIFLIGGEPGIGKSRLADEFAAQARQRAFSVFSGRCWEDAGAPAYWPWIQVLRAMLRALDPPAARALLGPTARDLAQLLPEVRELLPDLPPPPADSDSARFQLFDSTATFLRRAALQQPSVLVLDDLHAADRPSVLLLRFLASQLADMHLVVVITYRDVALTPSHPLADALSELAREPVTRTLSLGGLREEDVGRFIAAAAGVSPAPRLTRGMWQETSGNPLFLKEATRLLVSEGRLDQAAAAGSLRLAVPASVREVIARRVRQLSPDTVQALTTASALGPEFSLQLLARVGSWAPEQLQASMGEAVAAGLLLPVMGTSANLRFSHDLVRESLHQELSALERAHLHRSIGEALEEPRAGGSQPRLAELAHHYFEAAQAGPGPVGAEVTRKAHLYATQAAQQAAQTLAYEEAARLLRMALATLDVERGEPATTRLQLLLAIGDAESRSGDLDNARRTLHQAADIARGLGDVRSLALAALGSGGRLAWSRPGNDDRLVPLLQDALVLLGGVDERLRVRLLTRLACAWRSSPEHRPQSEALSREAVEVARRLGDSATLGSALVGRYYAILWPENVEERLAIAREAVELADSRADRELSVDAHLLEWHSLSEVGRMREASLKLDELAAISTELRQPAQLWLGVGPRALIALMEGDFGLAERLIDEELRPWQPLTPARDNVSSARLHQFLLARARDRLVEVESQVREAARDLTWYPLHRAALAVLLGESGKMDEAAAVLSDLARDEFAALYRDNEWLLGSCLAAEACWLLAEETAAAVLYAQLAPFAGRHAIGHAEGSVGAVDRYLGLLAWTIGRPDEAERHLTASIKLNERLGARPWLAHSLHDLAALLGQRRSPADQRRAGELAQAALRIARSTGMMALQRRLVALAGSDGLSSQPEADGQATFQREGEYWSIAFGGEQFRLRDSKGLHYLARLLAQPGREMLALELAQAASAGSTARLVDPELHAAGDAAGPQLDEHAKQEYRARLHELQQELEEAEGWNDPERAERAREEMDFIAREISGAVGLGGRDRPTGSLSERARLSVTRAIRLAMARIAEHSAALGEHLELTIHTGTYCAYRPDPRAPIEWQL